MVYYLKIGEVTIEMAMADDLFLIDDWRRFVEIEWGKNYLIGCPAKIDLKIKIDGLKTDFQKMTDSEIKRVAPVPVFKNGILRFNNLLNFAYFLYWLRLYVEKKLEERQMLVVHAAAIVAKNQAILIVGDSGSGKSTALNRLQDYYLPLGEDSVILGLKKKKVVAYVSPLNLKMILPRQKKDSFEVAAVVTIKKNMPTMVTKINPIDGQILLINQMREILNSKEKGELAMTYARALNDRCYEVAYRLSDNLKLLVDQIINEKI